MRLLLTCPQGQVSGGKGRRHLLTRPWGRISATPHKTWVFPLTCPSSFLRPWGNFGLALSVTAAPCQRLGCRLGRPLGNVPPGRNGPQGGSQVGTQPEVCRKPSLASPFGGGGLALARTERASCQRPPRMGCVEALAGCPLSRLTATAPPRGEPSLASPFGGGVMPKA